MKHLLWALTVSLVFISCNKNKSSKKDEFPHQSKNPSILQPNEFDMDSKPVLIKSARIMTATGKVYAKANLLMENGLIKKISESDIPAPSGAEIIDAKGLTLTPGLLDVHSHMGVYPSPDLDAHSDGNEATRPVTADVWAEHGFWPQDPDIWRALAGGITTIQVLPGSANLVGGRSFTAKLLPKVSAREMRFPGAPQGLKMACGENPKRVYKDKGLSTRMGNVAGYRKAFQEALEYRREQHAFETKSEGKPPKRNFVSETLAKVISGDILLHFHCYRADDISAILDVANEFGFKIRAIHHGLEAYKLADRLAKENVGVATWADWWGFKAEAFDGIPYNIALLEQAGAKAIVHSDSAVDIRYLNVETGKALTAARKLGLNFTEDQALAWVTKNAAWAIGLDDKIGTLEEGKMADITVWNGHPFSVFTKTKMVFINGKKVFDRDLKLRPRSDFEIGMNDMAFFDGRNFNILPPVQIIKPAKEHASLKNIYNSSFDISNVNVFSGGKWLAGQDVKIRKGQISSIAKATAASKNAIDGTGLYLTPGLIQASNSLGLEEISAEKTTNDSYGVHGPDSWAKDSLNVNSVRVPIYRHEGITTSVSRSKGAPHSGHAVAFKLNPSQAKVQSPIAFFSTTRRHFWGSKGKGNRSTLYHKLRTTFEDALFYFKNKNLINNGSSRKLSEPVRELEALRPVLMGEIPWVVYAERKSDIQNLIDLKNKFNRQGAKLKLVIHGAAEAWTMTEAIKKNDVSLIIEPTRQTPQTFNQTVARFDQAAYLQKMGVSFIINDASDHGAGRTRQEAGLAVKYGLTPEAALTAITETPAKVFGLNTGTIKVGAKADIVLWSGNPLEPMSQTVKVWIDGRDMPLKNRQRMLADKYMKK